MPTPKVFDKLRRASQQLPGRRKSSATTAEPSDKDAEPKPLDNASFLGLPPEIRNQIYEQLALDTHLSLTAPKSKRRGVNPIGLLLACRQTFAEYRPLLLSMATMQILVNGYNFGNVIRVLERLPEKDVELLQANGNLWIVLRIAHVPTGEDKKSLQAWHTYRSSEKIYFKQGSLSANALTFRYNVDFLPHMRPPRPPSRYTDGYGMRLDLLRSHIRMYKALGADGAGVGGELKRVREDMEGCAKVLVELQDEGGLDGGLEGY